jgi:RNA polymerase sigma-70 factor (ECF subfamily)
LRAKTVLYPNSLFREDENMASLHCNAQTRTDAPRPPGPQDNCAAAVTAPSVLGQIEACIPLLRRYALALLHDRDAADELVRDCLVQALDTLHRRLDDADVRTWLFATMHGLFMRRSRRRRPGLSFAGRTPDEASASTDNRSGAREDGAHSPELLCGLKHLPDEQRSAVLLVSVEDLTYAAAATVLGMPAAMMMSCLARGRERLRQFTSLNARPALRGI